MNVDSLPMPAYELPERYHVEFKRDTGLDNLGGAYEYDESYRGTSPDGSTLWGFVFRARWTGTDGKEHIQWMVDRRNPLSPGLWEAGNTIDVPSLEMGMDYLRDRARRYFENVFCTIVWKPRAFRQRLEDMGLGAHGITGMAAALHVDPDALRRHLRHTVPWPSDHYLEKYRDFLGMTDDEFRDSFFEWKRWDE